jgi:hypothetical protein
VNKDLTVACPNGINVYPANSDNALNTEIARGKKFFSVGTFKINVSGFSAITPSNPPPGINSDTRN